MTAANLRAERARKSTARTGFVQVLHAEWTKFASLRSNLWTLLATVAVSVGIGAIFAFAHLDFYAALDAGERARLDPVHESFIGFSVFGLLGFAVIGALAMTGEYAHRTIGSTFIAAPKRARVLLGKVLAAGLATLVLGTMTAFAAFFVAQPILARESLDVSITNGNVMLAVLGGGVYASAAAVIGLALGTIFRRTAATLVAVTTVFSVATIIQQAQPESWSSVTKFLPHAAGLAVTASVENSTLLSPGVGLLVLASWAVVLLLVAAVLLKKRDVIA